MWHVPEMQEPGPCSCAGGLLPSPCLLAPEPRTSAQTKLTARPRGWCSSVPFHPSSLHRGHWEKKGPEVTASHPVLGQQVRGKEGLPVEAEMDRPVGGRAQESESREVDTGNTA